MKDFEFRDDGMRRTALIDTKQKGTHCPSCKEEDYEGTMAETEGLEAWQWFKCNHCGLEWCEIYELARIGTRADYA